MAKITYRSSGVDIDAGNALVKLIQPLAKATARKGANPDIGGFAGLFDPKAAGFKDPLFMAATDGVGSKLKIAADMNKYDTIGIDLVAMCVNDLLVRGVEPIVFLDYLACGKLNVKRAESLVKGIATGCKQAGCALLGGETAEMPGLYKNEDYDLAGFAVGAVERKKLLADKGGDIGDIIIGLPSSGLHSNGFSLVRKFLTAKKIKLTHKLPFAKKSWGEFLLTPTRIYVKPVLNVLAKHKVKSICHITGGGFPDNLPRILPKGLGVDIDLQKISKKQPIYRYFYDNGIEEAELLRTFNCGVGLVLIVSEKKAPAIIKSLKAAKEKPEIIGHVKKGKSRFKLFEPC